jgi:hypothetical protein
MELPERGNLAYWLAWLRLNRCAVLLAGLILFILLFPFTTSRALDRLLVNALLLGVLIVARWALSPHRRIGAPAVLFACALACVYVAVLLGVAGLAPLVTVLYAALEATVTIALMSYVLDAGRVTADKIFGAIAAYVLLAMLFASLFAMLLLADPGALRGSSDSDDRLGWFDLFYFSVTMLTSTGFGDIVPVNDRARALVVVAQITGTMYVAFLIARLANLYPAERRPRPRPDQGGPSGD